MEKSRLSEVDALRGLAALSVAFVFHIHHVLGVYRTGPLDGLPIFSWLHVYGYTLVDLFFVISGFIFSHVYLTGGKMNASRRDFFALRFARLYPLHFLTLLAALGISLIGPAATTENCCNDFWHFGLNLFMLQDTGLNRGLSFNTVSWSISVEVFCYGAFYAVSVCRSASAAKVGFLLVAAGFLLTAGTNPQLDHIARGFCGFFAGTLAYRLRTLRPAIWTALLPAGFILYPLLPGFSVGAVFSITTWPALVVLVGRIAALRAPALRWLGDRSYSIYLVHSPVYIAINVLVFAGQPVSPGMRVPIMLLGWGLVLVVADLSFRFWEVPARRWIRDQLSSKGDRQS